MIRVRTLGPAEVTIDGAAAGAELSWRKNLALLVYLARSPRRARTREHLVGLLWGDKPEAAARHSLSEALRVLRRAGGEDAIDAEGGTIRLANGAVHLDCEDFETRAASGEWAAAASLVGGAFLEGFGVPGASDFEIWLQAERATWQQRSVEALVRATAHELSRGHLRDAAGLAERAAALGPTSDLAVRAAMRCRALAGDRAGALSAYEEFARRVRDEIGATPDRETEQLAERVRQERVWRVSGKEPARRDEPGALRSRRAPLVGRERELTQLLAAWEACGRGRRAALLLITGEAGSGRSRLLEELAGRARLDGAAIAAMRAVESDRSAPWSGVIALARGGLLGASGVAGATPATLAAFAEQLPEWADRFPASRGAEPAPIARAFSDVVRAAVEEQPVVLLIDDAQLVDRDSLTAVGGLLRDCADAPILVILAAGDPVPAEVDAFRAALGRSILGVHVHLGPLDHAALVALARWALPGFTADALDRLARRVAADSGGLPLLAVELLHAVANGLELQEGARAWPLPDRTLDQTLPGELPDGVVAAIRVGFRRLSAAAQRVLAAAAVVRSPAAPTVLVRVTGLAEDALTEALDELEWQRWLVADARGYAFVARIVGAVVAKDMVTPGQRERLRAAAGPAAADD